MHTQAISNRLKELKAEAEAGQKMLAELDSKRAGIQNTLLRIAGAIQVLEELLASGTAAENTEKGESQ